MTFPVRAIVRPACLNGQSNGQLSPSILMDTPVPYATWTCRLVTPAARAWRALSAAALKAGHTLKPSGPADSFRPYDVQERIFLQRFTTSPVSSTKRVWRGKTWYLNPGCALAAVPGTSNHGWGLAVDVGEETDGDTGTESIDQDTVNWLVANEERFGFSHEVQSEPWHVHYFSGDSIPRAVLDHEAGSQPQEEDEVAKQIVWYKGTNSHAYIVRDGFEAKHINNPDDLNLLRFCKVDEKTGMGSESQPLDKAWQGIVAFLDGPLKNV